MLKTAKTIPLIRKGLVPAAAVTTALLSPPCLGAPGDLDPAFGDVGRLGPFLDGPAWSLEPQSDGTILLGGGSPGFGYWGWYGTTNFVTRLTDTGTVDPSFNAADLVDSQLFALIRQPDGQMIAAGRWMKSSTTNTRLAVYRLQPNGSLDTTFGDNGSYQLPESGYGTRTAATSGVLDPDGRIVVAGSRDDSLLVMRLLPDGSPDVSFGTGGVFDGPENIDYFIWTSRTGARTALLRTNDGGYRATTSSSQGCQVVALTPDGVLDVTFGDQGVATVAAPSQRTYCHDMAAQPDGRLLVAGSDDGHGFAARLLADGQPDSSFAATVVAAAMSEVTAVAADGNTAVVVAGRSADGGLVMRLTSGGAPDATFGNAGSATFDLETDGAVTPTAYDLFVQADRNILAAGGICNDCYWYDQGYVVRLLGAGGESPGVLGVSERSVIWTAEGGGEAVVNVRRSGGRSGSVSVAWATAKVDSQVAMAGRDYTSGSGRLTWADGETAEQQIRVPILDDGALEEHEYFQVVLSDNQGGAGLGNRRATIGIQADGCPYGQIAFEFGFTDAVEHQPARLTVSRNFCWSGAVSVTLTPVSGTAVAGEDFAADPIILSWADGEFGPREAVIPIVNDTLPETVETFTVDLSNPTGGAVLGRNSSTTVYIRQNDTTGEPGQVNSGGGAVGFLSLLALGLVRWLRRGRTNTRGLK